MFTAEPCNSDKPSKRTLQVQTIIQSLLTTDLCKNVGQTSTADVETWGQNWKSREVKEFRTWLKFHGWGVAGSPLNLVSGKPASVYHAPWWFLHHFHLNSLCLNYTRSHLSTGCKLHLATVALSVSPAGPRHWQSMLYWWRWYYVHLRVVPVLCSNSPCWTISSVVLQSCP